ncbi:MAG: hypothetical protein JJE21_08870 [Spirochaetaceae bacterium]|nr:hypothetical protein [Spirochaetaceae bacterium]
MKKRFLALFAIAALIVAPSFGSILDNTTHSEWSAGISLGTNSGAQVNYRVNDQLTTETILGFGALNTNLNVEYYGMYKVNEFRINDAMFNVNTGLGVSFGTNFSDTVSIAPLAAGEITYSFDDEFPLDIGLRAGIGPEFKFINNILIFGPSWNAGLYGLWRFI